MSSPLEWFGLAGDADERALKRAYAQRLRATRPDEDPEGFQQLHAMYQRALAQCRSQGGQAPAFPLEQDAPVTLQPVTLQEDGQDTAQNALIEPLLSQEAVDAIAQEAIALAMKGDADALLAWLRTQPALWSLQAKARTGWRCVERLFQEVPPMPVDAQEALLGFFDLDRVQSRIDAASLARLSRRMQLAWELQRAHHETLRRRVGIESFTVRKIRSLLGESSQPFSWPSVLMAGFMPSAVHRRARFLTRLCQGQFNDLPASFDRRRVQFWLDATQGGVTRARLALGATRWLSALLVAAIVGLLIAIAPANGNDLTGQAASFDLTPLFVLLGLALAPGLLWALWMLYLPLDAWHGHPEHVPVRWPWLNLLMVPLLCATGAAIKLWQPDSLVFLLPLVPAAWLALRRFWRRSATGDWVSPNVFRVGIFLLVPLLRTVVQQDVTLPFLLALAMVPWCWDLWRQRAVLRIADRRPA
ncbi:hypothetical protein [Dyella sp. EPa41]|uniref:hypothetical protein n=1 Tax=Dyella sp. EPa41 TaxID=1561194 RepID=UPI00191517B8|nr:hypothetical protein [Dyella sp. EPa41]